ncbi:MAG: uroporphyrinogen decarboxylase family protein [Clostridia bacterium]
MTERERLLKVLNRETPDQVPWFADLGHWHRSESGARWDLFTISNRSPEVIRLHEEVRAGWYIEVGSLHGESYGDGVSRERETKGDLALEAFKTSAGEIRMVRKWNPVSFSWDIVKRMVETPGDLEVLTHAMERKSWHERFGEWDRMEEQGGHVGLGFPSLGYTGLGSLMSYYMGVENTVYAIHDEPELMERYIGVYNEKHLELATLCARSPAPHFIFGDNLSGDVQSPGVFMRFSFSHYKAIADCMHRAGKTVSAHLDGRLNKIIGIVAQAGIDVADACTPSPNGDLSPEEIRRQAGSDMVLFGGISPCKWLPGTPEKEFVLHVKEWLSLKEHGCRLVQSAGDQVPPGTSLHRIKLVREIVDEWGKFQLKD